MVGGRDPQALARTAIALGAQIPGTPILYLTHATVALVGAAATAAADIHPMYFQVAANLQMSRWNASG